MYGKYIALVDLLHLIRIEIYSNWLTLRFWRVLFRVNMLQDIGHTMLVSL